jgi:translation initiation factor IF-3
MVPNRLIFYLGRSSYPFYLLDNPKSARHRFRRDRCAPAVKRANPFVQPGGTDAILSVRSRTGGDFGTPRRLGSDDFWRSTIALDKRSAKSFIRINDRIRAREIRVIDENGEQMGILPPFEALRIARERGLDLVEVSPNAVPPVCRIQDYGRFLYEKEKSERAARKKQKVIVVKEVKFSVTVDEHDYQTKKNQAVRFLTEGDKVKASLRFRGRQMAHRELGYAIINRLIQDIGEAGIVEFMPRMEGTILHAIVAPTKKQEAPKPKPPTAPGVGAVAQPTQ